MARSSAIRASIWCFCARKPSMAAVMISWLSFVGMSAFYISALAASFLKQLFGDLSRRQVPRVEVRDGRGQTWHFGLIKHYGEDVLAFLYQSARLGVLPLQLG